MQKIWKAERHRFNAVFKSLVGKLCNRITTVLEETERES